MRSTPIQKMGQPRPLFVHFRSLQIKNYFFTTNQCEKMSCPSSIWRWDSNPRPLKHESSPITTRPGLPNFQPPSLIVSKILLIVLIIVSASSGRLYRHSQSLKIKFL